jgi:hypothetical protein
MGRNHLPGKRRFWRWGIPVLIAAVLIIGGGFVWINLRPGAAAQGADVLRGIFGDEAVGKLEGIVYGAQDAALRLRYQVSGSQPNAPWQAGGGQPATNPTNAPSSGSSSTPVPSPTHAQAISAAAGQPAAAVTPTITPTPQWGLPQLAKTGKLQGEGEWTPYITTADGQVAAMRTFLQPDPDRPFAIVAVVAFNLDATRLHYVLGSEEPLSDVKIQRPGTISPADIQPGLLLAVFNGGFKTRHGHFGVMDAGTVLIPPKPEMGTLVLYPDGKAAIGQWGEEIDPQASMSVWRQNGPLVVHHGQINPHVSDSQPAVWGYTVAETVPIWRSGIGISADGRTLYYFAGPGLNLPSLAQAMQTAGADNAIQLDINNYWVHFDAISFKGAKPIPQALFDEMAKDNPNRYLQPYTRDYFYITSANVSNEP